MVGITGGLFIVSLHSIRLSDRYIAPRYISEVLCQKRFLIIVMAASLTFARCLQHLSAIQKHVAIGCSQISHREAIITICMHLVM
jgi:hypothetical protein